MTPLRCLLAPAAALLLSPLAQADFSASPSEAEAIAKDAYLYGFPVVEMYKTLYAQAVTKDSPDYKAPFNQVGNSAQVFTPKDTAFVTPNSGYAVFVRVAGSAQRTASADNACNRQEPVLLCTAD